MWKWWDNNSSSLSFVVLSQRWSFCLINQFLLRASHPCWVGSWVGQRRWGVLVTLRVQSQKSNYESKDEPNFLRGVQHRWKGVTWLSTFTSLDIEQERWVPRCYSQTVKDVVLCKWNGGTVGRNVNRLPSRAAAIEGRKYRKRVRVIWLLADITLRAGIGLLG